jgi:hypothetical protein
VLCDPQLTHRSRSRELGQEGMCNRVRDRYEDKVARTLAQMTHSSRCGRQLCKQHVRSNMRYQRELIKNTYSTTAYAGLTTRQDLPRFIVYHSDVMWPYYTSHVNMDFLVWDSWQLLGHAVIIIVLTNHSCSSYYPLGASGCFLGPWAGYKTSNYTANQEILQRRLSKWMAIKY